MFVNIRQKYIPIKFRGNALSEKLQSAAQMQTKNTKHNNLVADR